MESRVRNDAGLDDSIKAFLEIGDERNRLVHHDFGSFTLEKTTTEIYRLYDKAVTFIDTMGTVLKEFSTAKAELTERQPPVAASVQANPKT